MTIEIVDFPINNGDFPVRYVNLPEGNMFHFHFESPNIHPLAEVLGTERHESRRIDNPIAWPVRLGRPKSRLVTAADLDDLDIWVGYFFFWGIELDMFDNNMI